MVYADNISTWHGFCALSHTHRYFDRLLAGIFVFNHYQNSQLFAVFRFLLWRPNGGAGGLSKEGVT